MKLTWSDQQDMIQEITGLDDASSLLKFKRDMNVGATMFLSMLGREYNRKSRFTDLVANQQYYQLPEDAHKLKEIIVSQSSSYTLPLEQIADEHAWRQLNMFNTTGVPSHYFIKGYDEVGLYPIPSSNTTDGIELVFSPRHVEMAHDDYTTGTITVTNGSATITGSSTVFTPSMVGRWLQVNDGTDGNWYKIATYVSATSITIENYYQGESGGGKSYRIGQVMDLPEEFLEGPVDYAAYRHYTRRGDTQKKNDFKTMFEMALDQAKDNYGSTTDSQVISVEREYRTYNPWRGDDPGPLTS